MSCYVSSNDNRFYVAAETAYGVVASIGAQDRVPALKLRARQVTDRAQRRDKTGSRTFAGLPAGVRRKSTFDLSTYLTAWSDQSREPGYGPLFRAALGSTGKLFASTTVASVAGLNVQLAGAHGLTVGQAITIGDEMRFVIAIVNATTVQVNAPFTGAVAVGTPVGATMIGESNFMPRKSTLMSTLETSTSRRGRS